MIYALEVVLLALLIWVADRPGRQQHFADDGAGIFHLFVILYLLGSISGDSNLGGLQIWLMGFAAVMLLPVADRDRASRSGPRRGRALPPPP